MALTVNQQTDTAPMADRSYQAGGGMTSVEAVRHLIKVHGLKEWSIHADPVAQHDLRHVVMTCDHDHEEVLVGAALR